MRTSLLLFLSLLCSTLHAERAIPYLVTPQWLEDHRSDKDLVILQVGFSRNEFRHAHIPGARFLWFSALAPSTPDLSTEMPSPDAARTALEELGITPASRIVLVFTGQNIPITTRMFLALTALGFGERTALLDGGLERWKNEGRGTEKGWEAAKRSSFSLPTARAATVTAEWISTRLDDPSVTVVDARTKNFYDGNGGGVARQGHIAGAKSLVFNTLLDSAGRMKPAEELQRLFDAAGIRKGSTVVSYCHVGQQATVVYFAARLLGYDALVYDGSFEEWNMLGDGFPVERTASLPSH